MVVSDGNEWRHRLRKRPHASSSDQLQIELAARTVPAGSEEPHRQVTALVDLSVNSLTEQEAYVAREGRERMLSDGRMRAPGGCLRPFLGRRVMLEGGMTYPGRTYIGSGSIRGGLTGTFQPIRSSGHKEFTLGQGIPGAGSAL